MMTQPRRESSQKAKEELKSWLYINLLKKIETIWNVWVESNIVSWQGSWNSCLEKLMSARQVLEMKEGFIQQPELGEGA